MVAVTAARSLEARWLDNLPQAVYVCDARSGAIVYYNQRAVDLWGFTPPPGSTESSLRHSLRLYNANGNLLRQSPLNRVLRRGTAINDQELIIERQDGTQRNVTFSATPLRDEQGELVQIICTVQDITGRKRVEEELRESEERFRSLVEGVKDYAIFMLDVDGCVTTWNVGAERIKGYTGGEIVGHSHAICYLPEDIESNKPERELQIAAKRGRCEAEIWQVRKDGSRFWASIVITPVRNSEDELIGYSKIVRDLTARRQTEEYLRHSEARLAGIIESAMDAIISIGEDQNVVVFNAAAQEMFRCEAKDAIGKPITQFIPAHLRDAHTRHVQAFGEAGVTSRTMSSPGTLVAVRSDGDEFPIEATISQVYTGDQKLYTVILRDITERRHIEEERHQYLLREQMARVAAELAVRGRDEFLSVAAHELKTPVTSLRGFAQTLLRRLQKHGTLDLEQAQTALKTIDQQSTKLTKLVTQLLDVARIQAGRLTLEPKETSIVALVSDVAAGIQNTTTKHNLVIRTPSENITAFADPIRLEQVLTNLIDNAVKYSPAGGLVDIDISARNECVRVAVTDQGIGIPPEDRQHIFNRYYRAQASRHIGGMGLGLHISHQIVDLHGGKLEAEFPDDGGTRFIVTLPITAQVKTE